MGSCTRSDRSCSPEALFDQVYAEHHRAVHAFFLGRTNDPDIAPDLLQETFLRVWRHRHSLQERDENQQRYWLFAIARNVLTDFYHRRATRSTAEEELKQQVTHKQTTSDGPDAQWETTEWLQLLDAAIARLPEELRTVLLMQVVGEQSSAAIGAALGKPAGTIRYQIALARKRLAEDLRLVENGNVQLEKSV